MSLSKAMQRGGAAASQWLLAFDEPMKMVVERFQRVLAVGRLVYVL